ncbi:MAG: glycosyltransferase [Synechococcus sp.]
MPLSTPSSASSDRKSGNSSNTRCALLVLGMHRSGTSALTRVLGLCGATLPQRLMNPVANNNEAGFWESAEIASLHDNLLLKMGSAWYDFSELPSNWFESPDGISFHNQMLTALQQDFGDARLFVLKDPRICRLVPFWRSVLEDFGAEIKAVLPIRHPLEVADSLKSRDGLDLATSLLLWLQHFLAAERHTRNCRRSFVTFDELLADWRKTVARIAFDLDMKLEPDEVAAAEIDQFLQPSRRHNCKSPSELTLNEEVTQWIIDAYNWSLRASRGETADTKELDDIHAAFVEADRAYRPILISRGEAAWNLERERLQKTLINRERESDRLNKAIERRDKAIERQEVKNDRLSQAIIKRDFEIARLAKAIEVRDLELSAMRNSLSWRLTNVLRIAAKPAHALKKLPTGLSNSLSWNLTKLLRTATQLTYAMKKSPVFRGIKLLYWTITLQLPYRLHRRRVARTIGRSGLFDASYYLTKYPDVQRSGFDPLGHYIDLGAAEGRNPGPLFDTAFYLNSNPDVRHSGVNPLFHYIEVGAAKGCQPSPNANFGLVFGDSKTAASTAAMLTFSDRDKARAQELLAGCERKFSIVMPTWNRRQNIGKAIDSVLSQSYPHFELLVADDGSNDGTQSWVESTYAEAIKSGQIRYLRSDTRQGVSAARNHALQAATGDWIAYLDSDNIWREDYLLLMGANFVADPSHRTHYAALQVHDRAEKRTFIRNQTFSWPRLMDSNFIDLNVFAHDRHLYHQLGCFDEKLKRLVDWDLIARYTNLYPPRFSNVVMADYYLSKQLNNITFTETLEPNRSLVLRKHQWDLIRSGQQPLRLAYVIWDFPALTQTFVHAEMRFLIERGYDIKVYHVIDPEKKADLDFKVEIYRVNNSEQLAHLLVEHDRNWCHSHFVYPTVTEIVYPAARKTGISFSFMPHAVDLFHHQNRKRNKLGEIGRCDECRKIMVYGDHHRRFLIDNGVPPSKIIMFAQAVDRHETADQYEVSQARSLKPLSQSLPLRVISVARFIEKKGLIYLLDAAGEIQPHEMEFHIYGYGPLEEEFRQFIAERGLTHITLHGALKGKTALQEAFSQADLFVLPCVEAENGDIDGMPTVFFHAMDAGVPVVGTTVSAIPDFIRHGISGFLVPPRNSTALAAQLRQILTMPPLHLARIAETSSNIMNERVGTENTCEALLDVIARPALDLFMVTYCRDRSGNPAATCRIIERVCKYTTTPFVLTIVDNASDPDFVQQLRQLATRYPSIRLIELTSNLYCGPASNIALKLARSEFVIYICSNEGYVTKPGWERELLSYMRSHERVALAGQLVSSPAWATGRDYTTQPWFNSVRNPEFARTHSDRIFRHVQGGLFILRRSVYEKLGGFNPKLPQHHMDVEYSYFLESEGWELGNIESAIVLSNKTRPGMLAFLDEGVAAVHPVLNESEAEIVDWCVQARGQLCNICGWRGREIASSNRRGFTCPNCRSTGFSRAVYRFLAQSPYIYRQARLGLWLPDDSLVKVCRSMFDVQEVHINTPLPLVKGLPELGEAPFDVLVLTDVPISLFEPKTIAKWLPRVLTKTGVAIFALDNDSLATVDSAVFDRTALNLGFQSSYLPYISNVVDYGLNPIFVWERTPENESFQNNTIDLENIHISMEKNS